CPGGAVYRDLEDNSTREWHRRLPGKFLFAGCHLRLYGLKNFLGTEVGSDFSEGRNPESSGFGRFDIVQKVSECVAGDGLKPGRGIADAMNLYRGPGLQRNVFVDPALVSGSVILGEGGLAGQVIPIRLDIGFNVDCAAISSSPTGGEVISL